MLHTVKTFNGHNINDGSNYQAALLNPHGNASAKPVYIEQAQADSQDAGTYTVDVQTKVLLIEVRNYANRYALIAQLKTWFRRGTQGSLVVTFGDDSIDYQLTCRAINLVQDPDHPMYFTVTLQTGMTTWRAVSETVEATWVVTGTSETQNIAVGGKDETLLSVSLTAVAGPASGYLYQNLYQLPNTYNVEHGLIPWCITVDTATLVTAGKMQADCDDLRIIDLNTGQELKRWIANPNNASTKVWINLNLRKGAWIVLNANVAATGDVEYLQFRVNTYHQTTLAQLPATGIVYHGTEWFAYNRVDAVNCRLYIAQRGVFGTTKQAHAAGDNFFYIQYPLVMKYGNASATAPSTDDDHYDDEKPLFSLASSSNTQWVWTASDEFYDPDHPNRTGAWTFTKRALGENSEIFYVKQDAETGDAAIGLKVASYQVGSLWRDENVALSASLYRASGITTVSMTGDKYRSNENWLSAILYRVSAIRQYIALWSEATPAAAGSWASTWTHNSVSVSPNWPYVELWFFGGYPGAANAYAVMEILTCTVDFVSGNIPTGTLLGETAGLPLALTIENTTTGDAITLDYMMLLNKSFVLDGEAKTAQYDGVNAHSAVTMDDESRSVYLRLQGGVTNTIQISGADLGEMNVVLSYYARRQ